MSENTKHRLVILRHSKSDRPEGVADHERPLAKRGRKDAPAAGRWLAGSGVRVDLALCSTAQRCRETWQLAGAELPERARTVYEERVYEASLGELIALVHETSDEAGTVLLVGHSPGVSELAEALPGAADGDLAARLNERGFPTSAIAVIDFEGSWEAVERGAGRLVGYWVPRP